MPLTVYHAEHRCAPCRDMRHRIDVALLRFAHSTGLDATDQIQYVDIDAEPDKAPEDLEIVPTLILKDCGFRSDGRISTEDVGHLLAYLSKRFELPAATTTADPDEFSEDAPSGAPVFYRTYSRRKVNGNRENYAEMVERVVDDIVDLGQLGEDDAALVRTMAEQKHTLPSGRWLWTGGTPWIRNPRNYSGAYNCTNTTVNSPSAFGLMMELAMMGSGTGAILEKDQVQKLPKITTKLEIVSVSNIGARFGDVPGGSEETRTDMTLPSCEMNLHVGDSRAGWCDAYQCLIDWAMGFNHLKQGGLIRINIDLGAVRPAGTPLKGFGGTSNPVKLETMFRRVVDLLNAAQGRYLTPLECCLLIDEAAACVVAGNIRRSAGMRQFSSDDPEAATAKLGLYSQDEAGNWRVDPVRENLRMANHTRVFHRKPQLAEIAEAVRLQVESGEGAIQYAPEAIARSNADLLKSDGQKKHFLDAYTSGDSVAASRRAGIAVLKALANEAGLLGMDGRPGLTERELSHRIMRYGLNPCGEILGEDFHCNLAEIHLNTLDPIDHAQQADAFRAGALEVAALLFHKFKDDRYQFSRQVDPIVGVSFTGLFDFFVAAFGVDWLKWMMDGRPAGTDFEEREAAYLTFWREEVEATVREFCEARLLRTPNRTTTVQPAGTKSLLTGASSGWHPPKAQRFIRRITFGANDPVALAAQAAGYSVVPAPSARDDEGNLLDDINDPRSTEWLVEIPTEVPWANLPGADAFDLSKLSAAAQFGLWMNVQKHYTTHNTSATIELRPDEVDELSELIHQAIENDDGYISAALLQRFDVSGGTFPRLPFEPIDKATYDRLSAQVEERRGLPFARALALFDDDRALAPQESACSSPACLAAADKADRENLV